jgi:poly(hydroxyalkanoate) depolymerase family esterase
MAREPDFKQQQLIAIMNMRNLHSSVELAGDEAQHRWIEDYFQNEVAGFERARPLPYRFYLPANAGHRRQLPLLVMLHGCQQNARIFSEGTRMNRLAEQQGFAVLYPEQSSSANPMRCWNWFDADTLEGEGEAEVIIRLIDHIASRHPIDSARVYVAGMSAGGAMARVLAVRHPAVFAACAVHSGVMYGAATNVVQALTAMRSGSKMPLVGSSIPAEFVPTLVIHGDRDDSVHPINAAQIVQQCQTLAANVTSGLPLSGPHERQASAGGRDYVLRDYRRQEAVLIREIMVRDLGHSWSGGDANHPFHDPAGPCASALIWDFVALHRRDFAVDGAKPHSEPTSEQSRTDVRTSNVGQRLARSLKEVLRGRRGRR